MLDCSAVTVGICNYRREYVVTTLESVLKQEQVFGFQIIVIDNDEQETGRALIQPFIDKHGSRIRYVHAPSQNISIARNAALDHVETRWLAFIDDDEYASYNWLRNLAGNCGKADIVLGPVQAVYCDEAPSWASQCDFHSTLEKENIWNAYTGNVLIDMDAVRRCAARFDLRLGKTGGEDTFFFRHLKAGGASILYERSAIVYEGVPPSRASASWVLWRKYRSGQTHWDLTIAFAEKGAFYLAASAAAKSTYSLAMAGLSVFSKTKRMKWLARSAFHAGVVSKVFGSKTREEYAAVTDSDRNLVAGLPSILMEH